jgi:hypothetical protein
MVPGLAKAVITFTVRLRAVLGPQPLLAVTATVPPELPAVVVIVLVLLVPVQPEGSVQV